MSSAIKHIGILGCAGVARYALLDIVAQVPALRIAAIASRDGDRARALAQEYGVARYYDSYAALLADPAIDLIYNPLPNSLHCEWSIRALRAGKAVLCEKPGATNAREARAMAAASAETGLPLIEAYHYRYHPLADRIAAIVRSGRLGRLRSVSTRFQVPKTWLTADNIRLDYHLGGGATLDPGCYCVDLLRLVTGAEPVVKSARARLLDPRLDLAMSAALEFPDGCTGSIETALDYTGTQLDVSLDIVGEHASLQVVNPYMPHEGHSLTVKDGRDVQIEQLTRTSSYLFQLQEVARVLHEGLAARTPIAAGVGTMVVLDAIYRSAGLPLRGVDIQEQSR